MTDLDIPKLIKELGERLGLTHEQFLVLKGQDIREQFGLSQWLELAIGQVGGQVLHFCQEPRKAGEIQELPGLRHRENFQNNYLKPLLDKGWLERIIPDKPRSRLQKYRLTPAGEKALKKRSGGGKR